jgi:hypothetical protein
LKFQKHPLKTGSTENALKTRTHWRLATTEDSHPLKTLPLKTGSHWRRTHWKLAPPENSQPLKTRIHWRRSHWKLAPTERLAPTENSHPQKPTETEDCHSLKARTHWRLAPTGNSHSLPSSTFKNPLFTISNVSLTLLISTLDYIPWHYKSSWPGPWRITPALSWLTVFPALRTGRIQNWSHWKLAPTNTGTH